MLDELLGVTVSEAAEPGADIVSMEGMAIANKRQEKPFSNINLRPKCQCCIIRQTKMGRMKIDTRGF